jgi:DNA-binding CsgD family transcriptional regulator
MRALLALPRVPRRTVVAVTAAIIVYQAGYTVAAMMLPPSAMDTLYLPGIAVGSAYLLFVGIVMVRGARAEDEGTVRSLVHRLGVFTIVFAPLSTLAYVLKQLFPEAAALQLSYDFLFFVVWSAITVGVFVRYMNRPTALLEQGHVSEGFVKRYGITPREAEVVKLISFGLSNQEIADRMCVSFTTARTHIYNIFRKTDAKTRVELLRIVTGFRE